MPTYNVQVTVNVPGIGAKTFTQSVTAPTIEDAIKQAEAAIVVETIAVQKTA